VFGLGITTNQSNVRQISGQSVQVGSLPSMQQQYTHLQGVKVEPQGKQKDILIIFQ
jgi:hypothetical protein